MKKAIYLITLLFIGLFIILLLLLIHTVQKMIALVVRGRIVIMSIEIR